MFERIPPIHAWLFGLIASFWLSLSASVQLLLLLMALDYMTGVIAACVGHKLCSEAGWLGLARKCSILIVVLAVHLAADYSGLGLDVGSAVAMAYCVNELISITENAARSGAPIPKPLVEWLARAKEFGQFRKTEKVAKK